LNFLRQRRLGIPRPRAYGVNVMVRRTRLERVNERVTAEGGVQRGLDEKLVAFCESRLLGYSILGRGLIETQRLLCFYGTQIFLQLGSLPFASEFLLLPRPRAAPLETSFWLWPVLQPPCTT
jgi:hypothetical protein